MAGILIPSRNVIWSNSGNLSAAIGIHQKFPSSFYMTLPSGYRVQFRNFFIKENMRNLLDELLINQKLSNFLFKEVKVFRGKKPWQIWNSKFIYSEKATKFCEISILLLSYVVPVKIKVDILQNFVAFSEYVNFR